MMVKLLRAHGECLGARKLRRTQLAAKSFGESHADVDPKVSEWGNPVEVTLHHPAAESIGSRKLTEGTETSKYLEEKKSNQRYPE